MLLHASRKSTPVLYNKYKTMLALLVHGSPTPLPSQGHGGRVAHPKYGSALPSFQIIAYTNLGFETNPVHCSGRQPAAICVAKALGSRGACGQGKLGPPTSCHIGFCICSVLRRLYRVLGRRALPLHN